MDEYASADATRRLWSKALQQKQRGGQLHRKEQTLSLPVLARRGSGQQVGASTRNSSLHAFLTSQLETNDRESYSRSQLRAMASSKLLSGSNNNVPSNPRLHTSVERLAPLDPASFEKTRPKQRRPLPEPLQAAINEVLAVRAKDDKLSDREDTRTNSSSTYDVPETPVISKAKRSSPCKNQLPSRRPEWRRYIRRIMMTKGIRGSTLARYRRLVGIIARKNLNTSLAGAVERVVRYRLEFRSAVMIQQLIHQFILRRRQVKQLQRHRAASKIQLVWRRIIAIEKQRKQHEMTRLAKIERLTRRSKARIIQRTYRAYQSTCRLREEQRRQLQHASMLQKARSKLLRRYQSWRKNATKRVLDQESNNMPSDTPPDDHKSIAVGEFRTSCEPEDVGPLASCSLVEATTTFSWIASDNLHCTEAPTTPPELPYGELVDSKDSSSLLCTQVLNITDDCWDDLESTSISYQQSHQLAQKLENFTVSASTGNQVASDDDTPAGLPIQSKPVDQLPCEGIYDQNPETNILECSINAVPEDDCDIVDNNESAHDAPEGLPNSLDQVPILNNLMSLNNEPDLVEGDTSESVAFAEAEARRSLAAKTIARNLKPKILSRHGIKTRSAVQIQCVIRSFLAKKSLVRVQLQKLHCLRVQLLASWNQLDHDASSSLVDKQHEQNAYEPENDDDENDFDVEMQGYHPHIHSETDNYLHLLPTRNGRIPPGVPFLQSSVAVPVLSLWKWSWSNEQWVGNGQ